jgi:hypothetical protein
MTDRIESPYINLLSNEASKYSLAVDGKSENVAAFCKN